MKVLNIFQKIRNKSKNIHKRVSYIAIALVLCATSLFGSIFDSSSVHAAIGSVTEYTIPATIWNLDSIGMGPDGNIWYTVTNTVTLAYTSGVGKLTPGGTFTHYGNRSSGGKYARDITMGSDGNLWFTDELVTKYPGYSTTDYRIIKMTPSGTALNVYSNGSNPIKRMTLGSDGNVWFISGSSYSKISYITPSGAITSFTPPYSCGQTGANVNGITLGPDGNTWFTIYCTGSYNNAVGKVTSTGAFTIYPIPAALNAQPRDITTGPDGNLWFTEPGINKIGQITTSGVITQYSLPTANLNPYSITTGSDGALWFAQSNGKIGRMTTAGVTAEYSVPGGGSIGKIITGPDGAVWFVRGYNIVRMATELNGQTISFTSTAPADATIDSPSYVPTASSTSGLPVTITVDSSSSGVCSIDGFGKVSYQGAGTCTLNANQAGDVDYKPALQVQQSFTVAPVNADTSVTLNCPATATVGSTVECTITVANDGPAVAKNVNLTALFSSLLSDASLSGGGTLSGQSITWSDLSFISEDSKTFTLSATASAAGKARFNAALLQTSPDSNISNNIADATIVISEP